MPTASIDFTYDTGTGTIFITDLAATGNLSAAGTPGVFIRAFLRGLIEEYRGDGGTIVVNTSCMSHLEHLEAVGFEIDDEFSDGHFVSAAYTYAPTQEGSE